MMNANLMLIAVASLMGLGIVTASLLRGWSEWLRLKEREIDHRRQEIEGGAGTGAARIELADLKERIRKLEAIAAGVDL